MFIKDIIKKEYWDLTKDQKIRKLKNRIIFKKY